MCECNKNLYTYEKIMDIKDFLSERCNIRPKIGIICGSGLGSLADSIENPIAFNYRDIPKFPVSTVIGHRGRLIFGFISNIPVICMQGRFHYYEGYPLSTCVMPIRLMKLLGVSHLILSNAAGAINQNYKIGDIMLQKDHYNIMGLAGVGPLIGVNDERFGPRFVPTANAYDPYILKNVKYIAEKLGIVHSIHEGVYTCTGGPNYESVADVRALKKLGVDAAGMSTVHEVIAANHCQIKCFAFSLITNICSDNYDERSDLNSDDVVNTAKEKNRELNIFVENIVRFIGENCL